MTAVEAEIEQAKHLVGFTVQSVCHTEDGEAFGLTLRRGKRLINVWVDCDPEGNGSGHLAVEEVER